MSKDRLVLKAIRREPTERRPLWIMRQAGRTDPEYNQLRKKDGRPLEKLFSDVEISIKSGAKVLPLPEGNQYLGFIFAKANAPDAVEVALRKAQKCLKFEII